jgi:hypothetical protein
MLGLSGHLIIESLEELYGEIPVFTGMTFDPVDCILTLSTFKYQ